jgi:Ca-activated chloride channel family protein
MMRRSTRVRLLAMSLGSVIAVIAVIPVVFVGVGAGVLDGPLAAQEPPAPATFSARVDAVRVDVDVRRGNRPVAGLTADDFEIVDSGVRQRAELVSPTALPLNVVLALDGSASLDAREREHLIAAGHRVVEALRGADTAALVTFADRVAIRSTFTDDAARLRSLLAAPTPAGDTALYDAAHVAMLLGASAPGRPIVILFSDGEDTASLLTGETVVDTARRTGAVVCVVALGEPGPVLPRLAEVTGGVFIKETSLNRVAARFGEILESFRHRYLVSYTPTGVPREGWHPLTVRVKGGGDIRARSGYWAGPSAAPR